MVILGDEGFALAVGALTSVHLLHQNVKIQIIIYLKGVMIRDKVVIGKQSCKEELTLLVIKIKWTLVST